MSQDDKRIWRVSTYTGGEGNCVEVAGSHTAVAIRDTKDRQGPELRVTAAVWRTLISEIKAAG